MTSKMRDNLFTVLLVAGSFLIVFSIFILPHISRDAFFYQKVKALSGAYCVSSFKGEFSLATYKKSGRYVEKYYTVEILKDRFLISYYLINSSGATEKFTQNFALAGCVPVCYEVNGRIIQLCYMGLPLKKQVIILIAGMLLLLVAFYLQSVCVVVKKNL